jgi:hypothetical protein
VWRRKHHYWVYLPGKGEPQINKCGPWRGAGHCTLVLWTSMTSSSMRAGQLHNFSQREGCVRALSSLCQQSNLSKLVMKLVIRFRPSPDCFFSQNKLWKIRLKTWIKHYWWLLVYLYLFLGTLFPFENKLRFLNFPVGAWYKTRGFSKRSLFFTVVPRGGPRLYWHYLEK